MWASGTDKHGVDEGLQLALARPLANSLQVYKHECHCCWVCHCLLPCGERVLLYLEDVRQLLPNRLLQAGKVQEVALRRLCGVGWGARG